ncbi:MAG: acyl-CoA carboxylase subunit beta [Myxococcales bacterium]|nr:MAG: acyl-CoA carboxylase subunit beta [Myxococcales bacterium]
MSEESKRTVLSARGRLEAFFDEGTFNEIDRYVVHHINGYGMEDKKVAGDSVVTGYGHVDGRPMFAFSQDASFMGGSLGEAHAKKVCKVMDLAAKEMSPLVGFNDSGGARLQEGVISLGAYGDIFFRNVRCSGVIPQISVINGHCAGGAVYSPAMTDFILMVEGQAYMFITGPKVVKAVTGENVSKEDLGGAHAHAAKSGVCHLVCPDDYQAAQKVRELLSFLPQNSNEKPRDVTPSDAPERACPELLSIAPDDPKQGYDVRDVIRTVMDDGYFLEIHEAFAPNLVVGFARLNGHAVGVVANQPRSLAGTLDCEASRKGARFIRTCDAFNVPLVTFVDVPGFLPGVNQEHNGIILHGAKILFAFSEATVPKLTVILRKAFGGAYDVMSSKHIGGDFNFAWPQAQIAVMGAAGAVEILHHRTIKQLKDEGREEELKQFLADQTAGYEETYLTPYMAAEHGYIDDVIAPDATRQVLARALEMVRHKMEPTYPRRHRNVPL